ncbi:MAG TPA: hypothetical protein PKW79_06770 [Rhabdochlamydiaceae bacterium]|nr:hypothetical protein [Rhabdochlamydiaceae bacterium]
MQLIRAVSALVIFGATALYTTKLIATIRLDQIMTVDEQKKTGITKLSETQKKELEAWINSKFILKTATSQEETISVQVNLQNGSRLLLSNNTLYEVAPPDRAQASAWLSVIVTIEPSGDPTYPWKITNTATKSSIKAKLVPQPAPQPTQKSQK